MTMRTNATTESARSLDGEHVDHGRRRLLYGLAVGSLAWREVLSAAVAPAADRQIAALEVIRVQGRRAISGANQQVQSHPSHIWSPPREYHEPPPAAAQMTPVSALYLKVRTKGGVEGLYGPIDHEQVPVLLRDLAPFLVGRDPVATEELWDRMYRQNRHGRAGHYMMAISASAHDAHLVPHGHALRAALHVIASQSPATCPMGECLLSKFVSREHPWYFCHFEAEPLKIERGEVVLPESPGFGIALDPARVERQEVVRG